MTVVDLKREIALLEPEAQNQLAAFIVHLNHERDPEYSQELERRLDDRDSKNWVPLGDLKAELGLQEADEE